MHHSNIDRQYAYWQKLQELRGKSAEANYTTRYFPMPPFTHRNVNPFHHVTGENPVQSYGLDYEKNYRYKFDYLLFEGKTPEEFELNNSTLCNNKTYAGVTIKDMSKKTTNNIRILKTDDDTVIATVPNLFTTFGIKAKTFSKNVLDFDLTETLTEASQVEISTLIGLSIRLSIKNQHRSINKRNSKSGELCSHPGSGQQ